MRSAELLKGGFQQKETEVTKEEVNFKSGFWTEDRKGCEGSLWLRLHCYFLWGYF